VNNGGEDEVLGRDGGAAERPGHVHRTMAAHGSLQQAPYSSKTMAR
jgi:hypothetical protein